MNLPLILVNFKIYQQATGDNALHLAKIHEKVANETGASIAIAVSAIDIWRIAEAVKIPVFAQHMDAIGYGSHTGFLNSMQLKEAGAYGTLLNHAEHQLSEELIEKSLTLAREAGLFTVLCANTPERGRELLKYNPDLIAVEPPELIGGDISISKKVPDVIANSVELIGENRVLVGAGVNDADDVKISRELGASGVLLASAVVKSSDPYAVLMDLVSGL